VLCGLEQEKKTYPTFSLRRRVQFDSMGRSGSSRRENKLMEVNPFSVPKEVRFTLLRLLNMVIWIKINIFSI